MAQFTMRRSLLLVLVWVVGVGSLSAGQRKAGVPKPAPAPTVAEAPAPEPPPALSELEVAYVQIVNLAGQLAGAQCQALDSAKQFADVKKDATARIEKAHAGLTIDWTTNTLVPRP